MEFKDIFKELRIKKNLKQGEIAEVFNTDRSTIGKWEQGKNKPTMDLLMQISDYFGVSLDYLCGRPEKAPSFPAFERNKLSLTLLEEFSHLNDFGKREAVKRVSELGHISAYCSNAMPIAAHTDKAPNEKELELLKQDIDEL